MSVSYHQGRFPPPKLDLDRLLPLVGPANAAVARFNGLLAAIPNPNVLLSPLTSREAVLSSKIEGTQVTLGEVLEYEAQGNLFDESTVKKADAREVLNYRAALNHAKRLLTDLPLCERVLKEAHQVLMDGVRGRSKSPGNYRQIPNWIGPDGCTVQQARFIPPDAHRIPECMKSWETYVHSDAPDRMIQLAIVHAEFEAIHPFLDGNGRLGRLIIPLFLFAHRLLQEPNFYMSAYLEENRDEYYERLLAISRDDDWTGWVDFFLRGIIRQADENFSKANAMVALHTEKRDWVVRVTHSQYAVRALDWIFQRPIFRIPDLVQTADIPAQTARNIIRALRDNGMLRELVPSSGRAPAVLAFPELLNIAEGRDAF